MRCFYCDRIERHSSTYPARDAAFDLASEAPRCSRHWRLLCSRCGRPDHFMAVAYCPHAGQLFCRRCATETQEVPAEFWGYSYYFTFRSPWSGQWCPSLDRLEFEGRSPLAAPEALAAVLTAEADLPRYPPRPLQWPAHRDFSEAVTGVELSDEFGRLAREREANEPLGITYIQGSAARMDFFASRSFEKAVSNYVLMDVRDYEAAVSEVFRVLQEGGAFVAVISHPAFGCGPSSWLTAAPDSPRPEDRTGFIVDDYFHRGAVFAQWGDLDPVLGFHRPLRDYWRTFQRAGFRIDDFEEPSVTARGRRELPPSRVHSALRIPWSCIFKLVKP